MSSPGSRTAPAAQVAPRASTRTQRHASRPPTSSSHSRPLECGGAAGLRLGEGQRERSHHRQRFARGFVALLRERRHPDHGRRLSRCTHAQRHSDTRSVFEPGRGQGRGRTGGEGLLLRARRAFLCRAMSTQQGLRKPREGSRRHGKGTGSDRPRGACTLRTRPPPRRCCRHPSAAGADRRTHRCRHHTPATAQQITPQVSDAQRLSEGSEGKGEVSRESSPYPRAAAA